MRGTINITVKFYDETPNVTSINLVHLPFDNSSAEYIEEEMLYMEPKVNNAPLSLEDYPNYVHPYEIWPISGETVTLDIYNIDSFIKSYDDLLMYWGSNKKCISSISAISNESTHVYNEGSSYYDIPFEKNTVHFDYSRGIRTYLPSRSTMTSNIAYRTNFDLILQNTISPIKNSELKSIVIYEKRDLPIINTSKVLSKSILDNLFK